MFGSFLNVESLDSLVQMRDSFCDQNTAFNPLARVGGGSCVMFKGDTTTIGVSINNIFFSCLSSLSSFVDSKGAIIQFYGTVNDTNSLFLANRKAICASAFYICSSAVTFLKKSRFIWNLAQNLGGAVGITQNCMIYMEDILFLGCSSNTMGGVMSVTERSQVTILRGNFTDNSASSEGVLHCLENYDSEITIIDSVFHNNSANDCLFNLMVGILKMVTCDFTDNFNVVFLVTETQLYMTNMSVINHLCDNLIIGCLVNSIHSSVVMAENLYLSNFSKFKIEGNVYLEFSVGVFKNVTFDSMQNEKKTGSCFSLLSSNLSIDVSSFFGYDFNCIYGTNSSIKTDNSLFDNRNFLDFKQNDAYIQYGTIYCLSCFDLNFSKSFFFFNTKSDFGGAIGVNSLINSSYSVLFINNCSFIGNEVVLTGGAIDMNNFNGIVENCNFEQNKADVGAAINFQALCIKK